MLMMKLPRQRRRGDPLAVLAHDLEAAQAVLPQDGDDAVVGVRARRLVGDVQALRAKIVIDHHVGDRLGEMAGEEIDRLVEMEGEAFEDLHAELEGLVVVALDRLPGSRACPAATCSRRRGGVPAFTSGSSAVTGKPRSKLSRALRLPLRCTVSHTSR